jgi:hypothetical protein
MQLYTAFCDTCLRSNVFFAGGRIRLSLYAMRQSTMRIRGGAALAHRARVFHPLIVPVASKARHVETGKAWEGREQTFFQKNFRKGRVGQVRYNSI